MDIICIGRITSYIAHNVRTIFHVYSSCVSDWYTKSNKSLLVGTISKIKKGGNWDKNKIRVGTSLSVKVRYINGNIMKVKSISMRKILSGWM